MNDKVQIRLHVIVTFLLLTNDISAGLIDSRLLVIFPICIPGKSLESTIHYARHKHRVCFLM